MSIRRGYPSGRQHNRFHDGPKEREANKHGAEVRQFGKAEADRRARQRRLFNSLPSEQREELNTLSRKVSDLEMAWEQARSQLFRDMVAAGFYDDEEST